MGVAITCSGVANKEELRIDKSTRGGDEGGGPFPVPPIETDDEGEPPKFMSISISIGGGEGGRAGKSKAGGDPGLKGGSTMSNLCRYGFKTPTATFDEET